MRNTLRAALLTGGLLAATLPMSALAADAPTSPAMTRAQRHAANLANDAVRAKRLRDGAGAVRWDRVGSAWVRPA